MSKFGVLTMERVAPPRSVSPQGGHRPSAPRAPSSIADSPLGPGGRRDAATPIGHEKGAADCSAAPKGSLEGAGYQRLVTDTP
jgi:hypothetical protein